MIEEIIMFLKDINSFYLLTDKKLDIINNVERKITTTYSIFVFYKNTKGIDAIQSLLEHDIPFEIQAMINDKYFFVHYDGVKINKIVEKSDANLVHVTNIRENILEIKDDINIKKLKLMSNI